MENEGQDTLFLALTRPPMKLGVPFEGFVANFVLTFFVGLWLGSPLYWLIAVAIHFPMRVIASKDHNFFRVWKLWFLTKGRALGSDTWGGSLLSPMTDSAPTAKERSSCV